MSKIQAKITYLYGAVRLILVSFAATIVATQLNGCITSALIADRAINGNHCVVATVKVGDTITVQETGEKLVVVKISATTDGTPYFRCNAQRPNRAQTEPVAKKAT